MGIPNQTDTLPNSIWGKISSAFYGQNRPLLRKKIYLKWVRNVYKIQDYVKMHFETISTQHKLQNLSIVCITEVITKLNENSEFLLDSPKLICLHLKIRIVKVYAWKSLPKKMIPPLDSAEFNIFSNSHNLLSSDKFQYMNMANSIYVLKNGKI